MGSRVAADQGPSGRDTSTGTLADTDRVRNVAAHLPRIARAQPDALAVAVATRNGGFRRLTCAELDRLSDRTAWALQAAGITTGTRTVLMVPPSPDFFALTFALFKIGAVPVFVDPGMGVRNLGACLAEAEPEAFVGIGRAQLARLLLGWVRDVRIVVHVGRRALPGGRSLARLRAGSGPRTGDAAFPVADPRDGQTAAILFTSGSTGPPKGVLYTHDTFAGQVRMLRSAYAIEPGEVDLATFPLFALFGPALGMASVVPRMDASRPGAADPRALVAAIEAFGCTSMFASPAIVDRLGRHCEQTRTQLPSLRRVISAGAPASVASLSRLQRALRDGVEIFTPYGATEALPLTSIGSTTILGETHARTAAGGGVCVGKPLPDIDVAIVRIDDGPIACWTDALRLPAGEIGEIVVRGPIVTDAYHGRPAATALAKIRDGDVIRHRMGDLGYLDGSGRLWMCGRKAHRVETAAGTLFTIPCEAIFDAHPAVRRSALVGVPPAVEREVEGVVGGEVEGKGEGDGRGEGREGGEHHGCTAAAIPVICIELERGHRPSAALTGEILALGAAAPHTASIRTLLYHRRFPVDVRHNAKIFREKLARFAARKLRR